DGEVVYENGIVSRTTASNVQHAGNHALEGPASVSASLPGMPASTTETDEKFIMVTQSGDPVSDVLHEIKNEQGGIESAGGTDGTGSTSMKSDKIIKRLKMFLK
ncbi:MAG: type VI secretion system tip protein VgrG, partial [Betaproteobacteria bacterium]|nr:type VI secretion system tip protein VgrG [Betaproteobacteria bacterium]